VDDASSSDAHTTPLRVSAVTDDASWAGLPAGVPVRNTTLRTPSGQYIATIEHLASALSALGHWSLRAELDAPEVPILDGSALPFADALRALGPPGASPPPLVLREPVEVSAGNAAIRAEPSAPGSQIEYTYRLDYGPNSPLKPHDATWRGSPDEYLNDIAPARTFSLRAEAEAAQRAGLFRHLTPSEMVVIGDDGHPIDNAWRLPNEPARHKLLDLIGDLALLGRPLHARVTATRAGHALTHELCRRILASHPSP